MPNDFPSVACPVCASPRLGAEFVNVDRRKGVPGRWHYRECEDCGVIFSNPIPSPDDIAAFYSAYYREADDSDQPAIGLGGKHSRLRRMFHRLSGDVDPRDFIELKPGVRALDYGSGSGTYLSFFYAKGARISGAEISDRMISRCLMAGLDVRRIDDVRTIPFHDEEFEVVYLMQVFEHLAEPHQMMSEIWRVLRPGGVAYFAVPNGRSAWRRLFGSNWISGWFAPFHIFVYDLGSLAFLANRHRFRVETSWSRTPESWFRLNLLAALDRTRGVVDSEVGIVQTRPVRLLVMFVLRLIEFFVVQRDCLVVKMTKVSN
jgi:SAM-dependent methyltransferase